ncbi:Replication factor C subunit 5 [Fusarium napiforme]|uniref:Replication factor C subunit 5 n=1 Tax=Fusarium napiforme TaxID=42672 RepID=A0A8H5N5M6_9HYPO|nr:Replication factor C subunit 5 [Fusarium napiforme]
MKLTNTSTLLNAFQALRLCASSPLRQPHTPLRQSLKTLDAIRQPQNVRAFSTTPSMLGNWLEPNLNRKKKMAKGRPRVATGGSTKGTTVIWGDYGLRMTDHHRRISAKQLKMAEDTIKVRLRGQKYRLYKRKNCNVGVYVSGNDMRMGKGKGSFDHWATRMAVSQILFEIRGRLHEQVVRDAFRLAGNKLPGQWEFVKKGEPPMVGITKLDGVTLEELKRPRRHIAPVELLEASSPTTETLVGSTSEASRNPSVVVTYIIHSATLRDNASSTISQKAASTQFSPPDQAASTMALIVDKHRPRSLETLTYHNELSDRLRSLAQSGDFPHLLVYGPSGAGKKTRIVATLKELYGPGVEKIKIDARVFQTTSNRKLEFNIVASVYHLEITPSDVGNYDRVVVQDLLKEVAQTQQVDQSAKQKFKVVVINEADHLTRDAQAALRRTMEKYSPNLRLILLANSTANIIAPIRSRTLLVRVAAPTHEEICDVLAVSAQKEGWPVVDGLHKRIAEESGRNLRRALLMYEAVHAQNEKVTDSTVIPPADWEALIGQIAKEILEEHSPARILQVRSKLYDLLTHCIPPTTILKTLAFKLIALIDDGLKGEVIQWAAFYEHRIKTGTKVIFHLEAFVAKSMRIVEMYLMSMDM